MYVYTCVYSHTYIHIRVYVYVYMYMTYSTPIGHAKQIHYIPWTTDESSDSECVYVCVCVFVYMYICIYVYINTFIHAYIYLRTKVRILSVYMYVYVYLYICIYVYVYTHIYIRKPMNRMNAHISHICTYVVVIRQTGLWYSMYMCICPRATYTDIHTHTHICTRLQRILLCVSLHV
jgi:hypothetical protein